MASWQIGIGGFRELSRVLSTADKGLAKAMRAALKGAVGPVAAAARRNASWSSRIPGTVRPFATARSVGVRAGGRRAPHARVYEGLGGAGSFRHPVFGNRNVWVTQSTRPFLMPAVEANAEGIVDDVFDAIDGVFVRSGFH